MKLLDLIGSGQWERVAEEGTWGSPLLDGLKQVLIAVFAIVGVAAVGYAIYLGFLLAKAPDEGKRKQAKKRIVNTIAGLFIVVILTFVVGTDGAGYFVNTTDIVVYYLENNIFTTNQVSAGTAELKIYRNNELLNDGVVQKTSGTSGINVTNGKITSTAGLSGTIYISVSFGGEVRVQNWAVHVNKYVEPAPVVPPSPSPSSPSTELPSIIDYPENDDYYDAVVDTAQSFWCPVDYTDTDAGRTAFGTNVLAYVTSKLEYRNLSISTGWHTGVDLGHAGKGAGRSIYAARIGKVVTVSRSVSGSTGGSGYGNYIIIEHSVSGITYRTLYGHLMGGIPSGVQVGTVVGGKPGDSYGGVETSFPYGKPIASMGSTGNSSGPHLHFEIRAVSPSIRYIDPFNGSRYVTSKTSGLFTANPAYPTFYK